MSYTIYLHIQSFYGFGVLPPSLLFRSPLDFSGPPLGFETSGFAGDTSSGLPDFWEVAISIHFEEIQQVGLTSDSFPAISLSRSGSVLSGSNAASSSLAAASSEPLFEYSVASVLMLSLSSLPFLGYLGIDDWENGRIDLEYEVGDRND